MVSVHPAIEFVLDKHRHDSGRLFKFFATCKKVFGWIAPETAASIAAGLNIARPRVDSMVQFYSFLYDRPVGQYRILFSDNITDRMQGSIALRDHMLRRLHLNLGEVSADGLASVDMTSCTGMCDQGPALLLNNRPIARLTLRRIDEICELIRARVPLSEWPSYYFRVEDNIRRADKMLGSRLCHRQGAANRRRPWAERRHRGDEEVQPARQWRRRLYNGGQALCLPQYAGGPALHHLQRRRGRAWNLQGPRPSEFLRRPHFRGDADLRLRHRRNRGHRLSARANTNICAPSWKRDLRNCAPSASWVRASAACPDSISI